MKKCSSGSKAWKTDARCGARDNARSALTVLAVAFFLVLSTAFATTARVNFAKYQSVTASGQSSTYSADFAVDGVVSNFHSFRTSHTNDAHTLELKFPRPVAIGSAHLYLGLDNDPSQGGLPSFKLQSHNGSQWLDIPGASVTENTAAGPGSFSFTVRVSDGSLTHEQPVSVTVESPLPSAVLDTDGDGLTDLLEYAFVTDPGIPNGNPFRAVGRIGGSLTLEFPWNWNATGLNWQLRHGNDLSNIATWPVVDPGPTTTTRKGNIDRITVSPAMAYPDRGFFVLEVFGN
jgi:hypothetical protein